MTKMTMIEALKKLEELNDYNENLVITNAGEPQLIENAIEDIQRNAEDPEEVFDLRVTEETPGFMMLRLISPQVTLTDPFAR